MEMGSYDRLKPPPVGVVGVLLLPPLLPLFVVEVGAPDMGVGVWLLPEEVGVVPGCVVEVGLGVAAPDVLVGGAVGFGVGFGALVGDGEGEGVEVWVGEGEGEGVEIWVGEGDGGATLVFFVIWCALAEKELTFTRVNDMSMSKRLSVAAIIRARGRTLWSPTLFVLLSMRYKFLRRGCV
jgi:hypothetical protein